MAGLDLSENNDSKYRNFTAQVDKCLKGFEYSAEWADLISALGRLIKVIQSNGKTNYIPRSFLVGKRLAQCLHPALPPGVHCKALECYDVIFRTIGSKQTAFDLPIYGSGLFTLLGPSAMTVKPPLFDIFENHLLPLGNSLHPAFMGLLLGLLPGLEQGAEFSERGNHTVEMFCTAVGAKFFYTCLWKLLIHVPSVRQFGTSFIMSHFNRRKPLTDQQFMYGFERHVLLHSLCCLFGDATLLVQRDALDFLQLALPIHFHTRTDIVVADGPLLSSECAGLLSAALSILLRRDASLNRRLFTWLRGAQVTDVSNDDNSNGSLSCQPVSIAQSILSHEKLEEFRAEHDQTKETDRLAQIEYFNVYTRDLLTDAVRRVIRFPGCLPLERELTGIWGSGSVCFKSATGNLAIERAIAERPFRIVTGLLDQSDLGTSIIENLLPDLLWYTFRGYFALKERSNAWINSDSTSIVSEFVSAGDCDSRYPELPNNMLNSIMEHVASKDATRSVNIHIEHQSCTTVPSVRSPSVGANSTDTFVGNSSTAEQSTTARIPSRLACADEFLRTAHLFLSNLDGNFLWGFIETQFRLLILSPDHHQREPAVPSWCEKPLELSLDNLCQMVTFLLSYLPVETYPGVRNYHLPRLVSHIMEYLIERIQVEKDQTASCLSVAELTSIQSVLDTLVCQISEYLMSMFDQGTVFVLNTPEGGPSDKTPNVSEQLKIGSHSAKPVNDIRIFASAVESYRRFFSLFCIHILHFQPPEMNQFLESVKKMDYRSSFDQSWSPLTSESASIPSIPTADQELWLDAFAHSCRLLVQMSNFPLLISDSDPFVLSHLSPKPSDATLSVDLRDDIMRCFGGDLVSSKNSSEQIPPDWFVCLLYGSAEVRYFEIKAVAFYTLLELFHASRSVHGWKSFTCGKTSVERRTVEKDGGNGDIAKAEPNKAIGKDGHQSGVKVQLTFPVLSVRLLSYMMKHTTIFTYLGISLWPYLTPSQSSYHEDVASLLVRLNQLSPPAPSYVSDGNVLPPGTFANGVGSNVEAYILSQMLSTDWRTRVEAQSRFALLWHFMRPSSTESQEGSANYYCSPDSGVIGVGNSSMTNPNFLGNDQSKASAFSRSIAAPCWRRIAMGLSGVDNNPDVFVETNFGSAPFPFYRCVLLLLDNLDSDSPWGPFGSMGTGELLAQHQSATDYSVSRFGIEAQTNGLVRGVLREQAVQWTYRALRTGQVDRLLAPILAALLHPATVRISLKARVLQEDERIRLTKKLVRSKAARETSLEAESAEEISEETATEVKFNVSSDESDESSAVSDSSEDEDNLGDTHRVKKRVKDVFGKDYRALDLMSMLQTKLCSLSIARPRTAREQQVVAIQAVRQKMNAALLSDLLSMPLMWPNQRMPFDDVDRSDQLVEDEVPPTMLPLHEHLVMHLQNYDANQVVYAFSRIRAILNVAPNLFVMAMAACPLWNGSNADSHGATSIQLFGLSLVELLTRHRRALAGGNFYGPASSDELIHTTRTQTNLLEVVINLCVLAMCSQLPYATSSQHQVNTSDHSSKAICGNRYGFTENEFRSNKLVQKTAAEVLELIVKELVNIKQISGSHMPLSVDTNGKVGTNPSNTLNALRPPDAFGGKRINILRIVGAAVRRTCILSLVLHCLASGIEVAHWPSDADQWLSSLQCAKSKSLPLCLRLLLINELLANLPPAFHTAYCCTLIRLTQAVLELHPFSLESEQSQPKSRPSESVTKKYGVYNEVLWPVDQFMLCSSMDLNSLVDIKTKNASATVRRAHSLEHAHSAEMNIAKRVIRIWVNAFANLPVLLAEEPLFRTACLSAHFACTSAQLSNRNKEQGALLLDVIGLALSPPKHSYRPSNQKPDNGLCSRPDMHPLWYHFVFSTFYCWGSYTPHMTRVIVTQICSNLNSLSELNATCNANAPISIKHSEKAESYPSLPPDYTLASLACLQGVYHALLLPGGTAASAASMRKSVHLVGSDRIKALSAAQLAGLPQSINRVAEVATALSELNATPCVAVLEPSNNMAPPFDPLFFSSGGSPSLKRSSTANLMTNTDRASVPSEPAVVLAQHATDSVSESREVETNLSGFTAIFTSRVKDLFNQEDSPNLNTHPLLQTQNELLRLFPALLSCVASLWGLLSSLQAHQIKNVKESPSFSENDWPAMGTISAKSLSVLTSIGQGALIRPAIRLFIEPLAVEHPDAFLVNMALAWPNNLLPPDFGGNVLPDCLSNPASFICDHVLSLLNPLPVGQTPVCGDSSPRRLPLLPAQSNLIQLLIGYVPGGSHFGLMLPASTLVNHLRDLVRRPLNNAHICGSADPSSAVSSQDPTIPSEQKQNLALNVVRLQVSILHMFYAWLIEQPKLISTELLLNLLRDLVNVPVASVVSTNSGLNPVTLPPMAVFLLMKIFNEFLSLTSTMEDRREQRELQEICHRLLESMASVAASALEQPTWFRRTLQVRLENEPAVTDSDTPNSTGTSEFNSPSVNKASDSVDLTVKPLNSVSVGSSLTLPTSSSVNNFETASDSAHSQSTALLRPLATDSLTESQISQNTSYLVSGDVNRSRIRDQVAIQAMELLAEHMAGFLDVVYRSDEKERVATFLTGILYNIFPYLRVRICSNLGRFRAASKLLASISSYQYTRKAWRREALDLLFEPVFFQMDLAAMQSWNVITDNLMTQDKNTAKEALTRLTFSQPGGLNLFSNKEAEHDLRAACLKKLSYLIYASEPDQYAKSIPDLLERLTDCLRLGQGLIPQVHAQVFFFARVLLARMSAVQLISLWPIIIPEMSAAFQSLSRCVRNIVSTTADEKQRKQKGGSTAPSPKELALYLSACKLLATGLLMPEDKAPQFPFYRWVFVSETFDPSERNSTANHAQVPKSSAFTPLLNELADLLITLDPNRSAHKEGIQNPVPLTPYQGCLFVLALKKLTNLLELTPFVYSLTTTVNPKCANGNAWSPPVDNNLILELAIEAAIAQEFPEPIPSR
ncbi:unnamed protein product [Calicophoron daubneyi]|uniref:Uncharacterized protein n=1 Tax=Calicophoron daubneyi TaxID=300641 RepID=A0AAV2T4H8_CALDB